MTAKNRHKNNEKSAASAQEDAPKKSPPSASVSAAGAPGHHGTRSGSCFGLFVTTVFYVALLGAAGFGAFHVQKVVEELRETTARQEESAQRNAAVGTKMDSVVQQLNGLRSVVDGLESSLGITRVELEGAVSRMKKNEQETKKVEEALQKLQNDLLRDLSEGINEVKEARGKDFASLEKTVEERLAEVSQSIRASLQEFTEAQGEAQSQLADLKARLGDMEDPALIKQELSAIVDAVAEIKTTKEASDISAESLREQISSVRAELQTRNQEVASLSQEVETVRSVVQGTVGSLKQSVSAAEASVQALKDQHSALEGSVEQAGEALRHMESVTNEAAAHARRQADDLETRLKASEESADSLSVSVSDISGKLESLLARCDTSDSAVAAQGRTVEQVKTGLEQEINDLKSSLGELQTNLDTLVDDQTTLTSQNSAVEVQVKDLEEKLAALEGRSSVQPEQLQGLRSMADSLEAKVAKLEGHDEAIATMQQTLQKTTETLAKLSKGNDKKGK